MTPEERFKVYSNDYADFMINYSGNPNSLEQLSGTTFNVINFYTVVQYVPVSEMTEDAVSKRGYSAIPLLFGTISESALEASGVLRLRSIPQFDLKGTGVLIGFVDTGIDYTNPVFQNADKTTRISAIWDQTIDSEQYPRDMSYGTEYLREQINEALKSDNPLSLVPSTDTDGHGTMLAGIAAGTENPEKGFYGIASGAELVIVRLKPAKAYLKEFFRIPPDKPAYQANDIIAGYQYLINYASRVGKPIVLCNAIDTSQYAHDGRGTIDAWLSTQVSRMWGAMIMAVGNEGNARRHYSGAVNAITKNDTVELNVGPGDKGFTMELWGNTPNLYSIDITSPSGEYIPRLNIRIKETKELKFIFDPTTIYIDNTLVESQSGDQLIFLRFSDVSPGIWKFRVYAKGIPPMKFNIWLPMNDFITKDTFFIKSDPYTTLLSMSCSIKPIAVTAYNIEDDSLYLDSGRGYTRIDVIKPDIAAPGVNILAPSINQNFVEVTGTSAAAAHTAGIAALILEWGMASGKYQRMLTQDVKIFMIRGARRKAALTYPNQDWGFGILDVFNIFESIRKK